MKTTCPHCQKSYDIPESDIMSAAGRIMSKRREKFGRPSSESASKAGKKGAEKRWQHRKAEQP